MYLKILVLLLAFLAADQSALFAGQNTQARKHYKHRKVTLYQKILNKFNPIVYDKEAKVLSVSDQRLSRIISLSENSYQRVTGLVEDEYPAKYLFFKPEEVPQVSELVGHKLSLGGDVKGFCNSGIRHALAIMPYSSELDELIVLSILNHERFHCAFGSQNDEMMSYFVAYLVTMDAVLNCQIDDKMLPSLLMYGDMSTTAVSYGDDRWYLWQHLYDDFMESGSYKDIVLDLPNYLNQLREFTLDELREARLRNSTEFLTKQFHLFMLEFLDHYAQDYRSSCGNDQRYQRVRKISEEFVQGKRQYSVENFYE